MGNGALPNGPSYRAHPRLYLFGHGGMSDVSPYRAPKRKLPEALAVPAFNGPEAPKPARSKHANTWPFAPRKRLGDSGAGGPLPRRVKRDRRNLRVLGGTKERRATRGTNVRAIPIRWQRELCEASQSWRCPPDGAKCGTSPTIACVSRSRKSCRT
jgi:hypothetical protein